MGNNVANKLFNLEVRYAFCFACVFTRRCFYDTITLATPKVSAYLPVAQWIARETPTLEVSGSNPLGQGTKRQAQIGECKETSIAKGYNVPFAVYKSAAR